MEVGIVGAVPFLIGLWLCGKGAWRARNDTWAFCPGAFGSLTRGGMSSTTIKWKAQWFVLALTVAAVGEGKRQGMILVGRPVENGANIFFVECVKLLSGARIMKKHLCHAGCNKGLSVVSFL